VLSVEALSVEKDVRLKPGEAAEVGAYRVRFDALDHYEGPNYVADRGHFTVLAGDGEVVHDMQPEKRKYLSGQVQTEAAIGPGLSRDFYVALGEPLGNDGAWAVRAYVKPFVRLIWLGALFMMFGGFVAAADKRYREAMRRARATDDEIAGAGAAA
jgi:cytochrome c-type biogenesis protein CcmF